MPTPRSRRPRVGAARTRSALVAAAVESLREDGFSGASARVIADRAGCNQSLVFYHFGSVTGLLLAALDAVSEERMQVYAAALDAVDSLTALVRTARTVFDTDLASGNVRVLVEMMAGSMADPALAAEVAARLDPWKRLAAGAVHHWLQDSPVAGLVGREEAAHLVVALYLGVELLARVEDDHRVADQLFAKAATGAAMLDLLPRAGRRDIP